MDDRAPYRKTYMDRLGPDGGLYLRAAGYSLVSIPLSGLLVGRAADALKITGAPLLLFLVVGIVVGYAVSLFAALKLLHVASLPAGRVYMGGSSTPYEEQYSQEQALVMQRRVPDALALYEHRIALEPGNVAARRRAADLYAGEGGNPTRAAELFREIQRIPGVRADDGVYACNRLADLYLGPLREPGRAVVELRKLIDLFPGTPGAAQARVALAELKARLHATDNG